MQLVKHESKKTSSSPRWVYKNGASFIKIIPYANDVDVDVDQQIELINNTMSMNLITGYSIVELEDEWDTNKSSRWNKNTYLKYTMTEVLGNESNPLDYTMIDTLMQNIVHKYTLYNIELFPYACFDVSLGNMIDNKLVDVDGILLGNKHTPCLLYTSPSPRDQRGSRMPSYG